MERGVLTSVALNGAGIIHDFELAAEDVRGRRPGARPGTFGMAQTGATLNQVIREAAAKRLARRGDRPSHREEGLPPPGLSVLAAERGSACR
jgi:hypothetical protein